VRRLRSLTGWYSKDLVHGREALGWFSLCVAGTALGASVATAGAGWPTWMPSALGGLAIAAIATTWYARGKLDPLTALAGVAGLALLCNAGIFGR